MPRKADKLAHQIHQSLAERARGIEPRLSTATSEDLCRGQRAEVGGRRSEVGISVLNPKPCWYSSRNTGLNPLIRRCRFFMLVSLQIRIEIPVELAAFHVLCQRIDAIKR